MTRYAVRRNRLKDKIAAGERIFGALLDTPSADVVEMLGLLGFDYFTLEGQHGAYDDSLFLSLIRAAEIHDMTPVVRVTSVVPDQICRLLDLGLQGVAADVETAEEARALVRAAKYPPEGRRGFGRFSRANRYGLVDEADAIRDGNAALYLTVSVDTLEGIENLPQILAVDGLDGVSCGLTSDLMASAGIPGQYDHPRVKKLEQQVGDAFEAAGKPRPRWRNPFLPVPLDSRRVYLGTNMFMLQHLVDFVAQWPERSDLADLPSLVRWGGSGPVRAVESAGEV
jgi:4-hydroxy-2-oxoheptanedioate aldolase